MYGLLEEISFPLGVKNVEISFWGLTPTFPAFFFFFFFEEFCFREGLGGAHQAV